ncbi:unnamed protein product, partial [Prorocentrum cordatum]
LLMNQVYVPISCATRELGVQLKGFIEELGAVVVLFRDDGGCLVQEGASGVGLSWQEKLERDQRWLLEQQLVMKPRDLDLNILESWPTLGDALMDSVMLGSHTVVDSSSEAFEEVQHYQKSRKKLPTPLKEFVDEECGEPADIKGKQKQKDGSDLVEESIQPRAKKMPMAAWRPSKQGLLLLTAATNNKVKKDNNRVAWRPSAETLAGDPLRQEVALRMVQGGEPGLPRALPQVLGMGSSGDAAPTAVAEGGAGLQQTPAAGAGGGYQAGGREEPLDQVDSECDKLHDWWHEQCSEGSLTEFGDAEVIDISDPTDDPIKGLELVGRTSRKGRSTKGKGKKRQQDSLAYLEALSDEQLKALAIRKIGSWDGVHRRLIAWGSDRS